MTAMKRRGGTWGSVAGMSLAAGLLTVLSACAVTYETACIDAGERAGSPELAACVQDRIETARADRKRNLKYSRGR